MFDYSKIKTEPQSGRAYRDTYYNGLLALLREKMDAASAVRDKFMTPEGLLNDREEYRKKYCDMLGWPLNEYTHDFAPNYKKELIEEPDFVSIYRLAIETLPGVWLEGLIYKPVKREKNAPLVVINPGGSYCCEELVAYGDYDCGQYKNVGGRFLEAGAIVYAPQYQLWIDEEHDILQPQTRQLMDARLKAMGGSITAVEVFNARRAIDYFIGNEDIDAERIGMMGLSYGGFYTLYISAADTRIKSVFSSCFFCDRFGSEVKADPHLAGSCRPDWLWQNSAYTFFDAEVSALIAPRALYLEGNKNDMFPLELVLREQERLKPFYEAAGAGDKLKFFIGDGGHEVAEGDVGVNFFLENLF